MENENLIKLNFEKIKDSNITRLTPRDVACHRNYFYQKCYYNNGNNLIFAGEFDGNFNYYSMDLKEKLAIQLSDSKDANCFGGFVSEDDKYLYYTNNNSSFNRIDLLDKSEVPIYQVPDGWLAYGTWGANSDSSKVVGIEIKKEDYFPLSDWQKFREMFFKKPYCRLISLDLKTGKSKVIYEDKLWLGHPLYKPFDDNTVAYCHEGPHDLIDSRIWFIKEDGTNNRQGTYHEKGESCTHEFWVPDGSKMYFVSYKKNENKRHISSIDSNTLKVEKIQDMPNCSHLMSNYDGTLVVGDGCDTPIDVDDKESYQVENDPNLYVFDIQEKTHKSVAKHFSSWDVYKGSRQMTHPHPSFSPDEKNILFTSDFEGLPALYLAEYSKV